MSRFYFALLRKHTHGSSATHTLTPSFSHFSHGTIPAHPHSLAEFFSVSFFPFLPPSASDCALVLHLPHRVQRLPTAITAARPRLGLSIAQTPEPTRILGKHSPIRSSRSTDTTPTAPNERTRIHHNTTQHNTHTPSTHPSPTRITYTPLRLNTHHFSITQTP